MYLLNRQYLQYITKVFFKEIFYLYDYHVSHLNNQDADVLEISKV